VFSPSLIHIVLSSNAALVFVIRFLGVRAFLGDGVTETSKISLGLRVCILDMNGQETSRMDWAQKTRHENKRGELRKVKRSLRGSRFWPLKRAAKNSDEGQNF
jgi:hypothetical protein